MDYHVQIKLLREKSSHWEQEEVWHPFAIPVPLSFRLQKAENRSFVHKWYKYSCVHINSDKENWCSLKMTFGVWLFGFS